MIKVMKTEEHDFYYSRIIENKGFICNIVPKNSKVPTSGYSHPDYILNSKGYDNLYSVHAREFKELIEKLQNQDRLGLVTCIDQIQEYIKESEMEGRLDKKDSWYLCHTLLEELKGKIIDEELIDL